MPTRAKPTPPAPETNGHAPPLAAPPTLATLDTEALRRKLAGLADPAAAAGALAPAVVKQLAIRFISILASLYNRDKLEAVDLWDNIGSALETSDAKAADDVFRFCSLCLEDLMVSPGRAAANPALGAILDTLDRAKPEDRSAFLAYLRTHRYPALRFGHQRWELVKAKEVEL